MTRLTALGALIVLVGTAGCASAAHGHRPAPSTPVTGTFHLVGGPAPGIDRPLVGKITVYSGADAHGTQVTVVPTDAHGRFAVELAPGTFFFVGRSADVGGVPCTSRGPVTLTRAPASVVVTCQVK
jgi:hypothetical protein